MEEQQEFELKDEVWSGASMLYTSEPMRSLVVEVETSSQVQGEVLQAAVDDKAFLAQLDERGIPYELGGERNFMTPRNGLIPALGLASA